MSQAPLGGGEEGSIPHPPTGTTWVEAQRGYIDEFGRRMGTSWAATQEFWKHLIMVEATVLGLTVGFIGALEHRAPLALLLSWVALLFAIAIGSILVKVGIDVGFDGVLRGFRFQSDIAGIMVRVETKELSTTSEEYRGLFYAAALQMSQGSASQVIPPGGQELADKYAGKLPTSSLFTVPKRTPVAKWFHAHWQLLESAFYALSIFAFTLLVVAVAARGLSPRVRPTTVNQSAQKASAEPARSAPSSPQSVKPAADSAASLEVASPTPKSAMPAPKKGPPDSTHASKSPVPNSNRGH